MKGFRLLQKRERKQTTSMNKQDFLVRQIDEFKEKAKQLQESLNAKESRVQELQKLVVQREAQADKLEQVMTERQKASDEIMADVKSQILNMTEQVSSKLEHSLQDNKEEMQQSMELLTEWKQDLQKAQKAIEDKVHTENVKTYRNIQMIVIEMNKKSVQQEEYRKDMVSLQSMVKCITWVGIINFLVLVIYILMQSGVFH